MHSHLTVVLPAAFVTHLVVNVLPGDAVMVASPALDVHGVNVTTFRIRPPCGTTRGEGILRVPLVGRGRFLRVIVRITRHALILTVNEELIDLQSTRRSSLIDSVLMRLPL